MGCGKLSSQSFPAPQLGWVAAFRAKRPHRRGSRCAVWGQYPWTDGNGWGPDSCLISSCAAVAHPADSHPLSVRVDFPLNAIEGCQIAEIYSATYENSRVPYLDESENLNIETTPLVAGLEIGEADTLPGPQNSEGWPGYG